MFRSLWRGKGEGSAGVANAFRRVARAMEMTTIHTRHPLMRQRSLFFIEGLRAERALLHPPRLRKYLEWYIGSPSPEPIFRGSFFFLSKIEHFKGKL